MALCKITDAEAVKGEVVHGSATLIEKESCRVAPRRQASVVRFTWGSWRQKPVYLLLARIMVHDRRPSY